MLINSNLLWFTQLNKNWNQPTHIIWYNGEQDCNYHLQGPNPQEIKKKIKEAYLKKMVMFSVLLLQTLLIPIE